MSLDAFVAGPNESDLASETMTTLSRVILLLFAAAALGAGR